LKLKELQLRTNFSPLFLLKDLKHLLLKKNILATIITIGDELLIGQTVDTNSAWMAQQLNAGGILVYRRVAVGDNREEILRTLKEESATVDIILITGGLGPTADDITKPVLCEYFGGKLIRNEEVFQHVKNIFESRGLQMLDRNLQQAMVPDNCTMLFNNRGTAPGMWFEREGKIFVSMPGVPHEMKGLMTNEVLPRLHQYFTTPFIIHRTLITSGQGESFVAERLVDFEKALPDFIKLAYLPGTGLLKLRLTATGEEEMSLKEIVEKYFKELQSLLNNIAVVEEDIPFEALVGRLLKANGKTISTAESCTGGYISHLITRVPGSSEYFKGSVISYANEIKENILHVQADTLKTVGAVSEETVKEMVKGALDLLKTDYAIAVSGIMGPDGGTPEKPVGTVWLAAGNKDKIITELHHLRYDRLLNIQLTSAYALNLLRKMIVS
jgi:competence/damage-inducible protein CinA-like protein